MKAIRTGKAVLGKLTKHTISLDLAKEANFSIYGNLPINNGVASSFSASNYIIVPRQFNVQGKTWELGFKIRTGSNVTTIQCLCGSGSSASNADPVSIAIGNSKFRIDELCASTTTTIISNSGVTGSYTVLPNTDYWVRFTFNGSRYELSYSLDGVDFVVDSYVNSTTSIYTQWLALGRQQGKDSEYQFLGSMDLKECYIKINGQLWWKPRLTKEITKYGFIK